MRHLHAFLAILLISSFGFSQTSADAWINEIHYDNNGGDVNEGVEIVVTDIITYPLANWYIQPYSGDSGGVQVGGENYYTTPDNQSIVNGFTIASINFSLQNGEPEGMALIYDDGSTNGIVVQFLSYDGTFVATNGEAIGLTTTDIGVSEPSNTPVDQSLQLSGTGSQYSDFTWQSPATQTRGLINNGQTFSSNTTVQFQTSTAIVSEDDGTFDLIISISNEDAINATNFNVELTSGNNTDIDGYTTQAVVFAGGDNTDKTVIITITDDILIEGSETLTLSITGVTGGDNAVVGTNATFDLTIADNDGIETIAIEDFDNTTPSWSNDIASQTFVDPSSPSEGLFIQTASTDNPNFSGNSAFGRDLEGENTEPSLDPYTFTFNAINVFGYTSVAVSFDFNVIAVGDTGSYTLVIDGITQPAVEFYNGNISGTISETIADGTSTVGLVLTGTLNSASDTIELDNFKIEGVAPPATNYTYVDGVGWSPANPSGIAHPFDDITVTSGNANSNADIIDENTTINNLNIASGAKLVINQTGGLKLSGTFTNDGELTIRSNSTRFGTFIADNVVNNSTLIYRRYTNRFITGSGGNDLISPPLSGSTFGDFAQFQQNELNLFANPVDPSVRLFGPYDKSGIGEFLNYDEDVPADAAQTLDPSIGYRAATDEASASSSVGILVFEGEMTTDAINTPIVVSGTNSPEWNLIGNPYPSYIRLDAFLAANSTSVFDTNSFGVYGYDDSITNYAIWNQAFLEMNPDALIAPGQGFFVASQTGGANVSFTPAMRSFGDTDDFIANRNAQNTSSADNISFLRLQSTSNDKNYHTDFYFTPNASQGLDNGYDSSVFGDIAPQFSIYSHLLENNTGIDMAIQSLSNNDINDVTIPIGVNANEGEQITFSIPEMAIPGVINVYLDDTLNNITTLLNTSNYIFTPVSNLNGTGRFFLRFSNTTLSSSENQLNDLSIFTKDAEKRIIIVGQLSANTTANIYDLQGRIVHLTELDSSKRNHAININNLSTGVYIVKLSNVSQTISKKVILK
ncbi:T9SS type A sorting domain-containing protein [Winogradskyella sp. PE311]|uniref:T9SS type A sorting domain-containing protein n=1 Tax=Winogradskyella sp. PE311 TaxID=3366943 RepID=UPI0039804956